MMISHSSHLLEKINRWNYWLQKANCPCLIVSNTQLYWNISTTGIFLMRYHHNFSWPLARPIAKADLKIFYFAPKSSQIMNPQMKLHLSYSFPIMHFDTSIKIQSWWCALFAEAQKSPSSHQRQCHRRSGRFCKLTLKPSQKMILTYIIVYLKRLLINVVFVSHHLV